MGKSIVFKKALVIFLALAITAAILGLVTKKDKVEVQKVETTIDISDWKDVCIGYHSAKVPPGLIEHWPQRSNHVDHHFISVYRDYPGSEHNLIESHNRFGGATFTTVVNGWTFVIAKEALDRDDLLISDRTLVLFGAKRIGSDMVLVTRGVSISLVGNAEAPKYREFYTKLKAEPVTVRNRSKGFCVDGYVFSGYTPQRAYDFWIRYSDANRPPNSSEDTFALKFWLSAEMEEPPKDDRKVTIPGQIDFEKELGIEVEYIHIDHHGSEGFVEILKEPEGDSYSRIFYHDFTDAPYGNAKRPFIDVDFHNNYLEEADSRAQNFAILDQLRAN